jgi:hypothetical protein
MLKTPSSVAGAEVSKLFSQKVVPLRVDLGYKPKKPDKRQFLRV